MMSSQTFSSPASLDNVTLIDFWCHHETQSANHPLFTCASGEDGAAGSIITWGEATRAMHASGRIILDALAKDGVCHCSGECEERPVIGILAVSG